ncbi:MAG: DUF6051 family protein [Parabacteroides sp.]|nr:DUF6051 family protein [Parabacteroides sp.]
MNISVRTKQLSRLFSFEKKVLLDDSPVEMLPFHFTEMLGLSEIDTFQQDLAITGFCSDKDNMIKENKSFSYVIFAPSGCEKFNKAIILLHGLNERSWEKYLAWAEYLVRQTGKPVILFPISFHMNRTPMGWCNPRETLKWVNVRKEKEEQLSNATFANVVLSSRVTIDPLRFYASGRQFIYNILQLVRTIKNGIHPLFVEDTSISFFAYSIGAMLSQILFIANPDQLFGNMRLFMFCGGSIFSEMNGNARDIMDNVAFGKLLQYYHHDFIERRPLPPSFKNDNLEQAFKAMICPEVMKSKREDFFNSAADRIRIISLKNDVVMPTFGIIDALGKCSDVILEEKDFPFPYSHQWPFPLYSKTDPEVIEQCFKSVFDKVAAFL